MNPAARQIAALVILALLVSAASAHPVPRTNHDRIIKLSLLAGASSDEIKIRVDYRLEVDELTVVLDDMAPFKDDIDPSQFRNKGLAYYDEYARIYGPILGPKLAVEVAGKSIPLTCVKRTPTLRDENQENLGHLRVDFVFEGTARLRPDGPTPFEFHDRTWLLQSGDVRLFFESPGPFKVDVRQAPDEALMKRTLVDLRPGDEDRLRELRLDILPSEAPTPAALPPVVPTTPEPTTPPAHGDRQSLLLLLQTHEGGFLIVLVISGLFGAVHALTPGHGKTLVAAYLVGQRGTTLHAIFLGLVTTLTHTGAVLLIAGIIQGWGLSPEARAWIQTSLPLALGLTIVCFGFFLLFQRLRGGADHFHVGGHHHHGPDGSHVPPPDVTWFGLILLGFTGGIVPCWDAIVMLVWAIGMNLLDWALPMLLAFSAGLASVLVLLGVLVVKVRGFAESRLGAGGWVKRLPLLSAVAIILLGFWLCREAISGD